MNAWSALYAALVLAAAFPTLQGAETLPVKPQRYFNDYTGVVQTSMANSLNERLAGRDIIAAYGELKSASMKQRASERLSVERAGAACASFQTIFPVPSTMGPKITS